MFILHFYNNISLLRYLCQKDQYHITSTDMIYFSYKHLENIIYISTNNLCFPRRITLITVFKIVDLHSTWEVQF